MLTIEYSDSPELTIYANLFSATSNTSAFNASTNDFITVDGTNEIDVAIVLDEISVRPGFYNFIITDVSNIPETVDGQFYLLEIFIALGTSFDRSTDTLVGTIPFYWDGEKEVDVCGCSASGSDTTAQSIWEYQDRTLTQDLECPDPYIELECPDPYIDLECPDNSQEIEDLKKSLEIQLASINETLEKIEQNQCNTVSVTSVPSTQTPRINRGSGGQSNIRVT